MNGQEKKVVKIGKVSIGNGFPIAVQSMLNCSPSDLTKSKIQIHKLEEAGCELIRFSVKNQEDVLSISKLKNITNIPLIADIHFDHKLAISSIKEGIDKIRINPGNIGSEDKIIKVLKCAKKYNIPLRVGANGGSVKEEVIKKFNGDLALAMVYSAEENIKILEKFEFDNIVVSLKSSDIFETIKANRIFSKKYPYPLHLGITEASFGTSGIVRSSIGIGALLCDGIGDTIRVSLTGSPVDEIPICYEILSACRLRYREPVLISCPTCGRCEIDLPELAKSIKEIIKSTPKNYRVAVMGCVVNGVGEGKEADIGIAGGKKSGVIFRKGEIVKKVEESDLITVFKEEWEKLKGETDK